MNKIYVKSGIDNIATIHDLLCDKKIGLITNPTGANKKLKSTADILNEQYNLISLFAPEHGVRGDKQAGDSVLNEIDIKTNLPIYSMYGKNYEESKQKLTECDIICFDIQDVGARFYTYLYTMTAAMAICAKHSIPFIVFDRPNPINGITVEGTVLDMKYSSFVGKYATPTRSGLTIGEFARYANTEENINANLHIVPLSGWERNCYFDETDLLFIPPSPNIPTVDTAICYIGTCLFEGTNLSEGRGTTKPFEIFGAPFLKNNLIIDEINKLNLSGFILRECYFTPTFSKHMSVLCNGIEIHITDRNTFSPFTLGIYLIDIIKRTHNEFEFLAHSNGNFSIDLLLGSSDIRKDNFNVINFINNHKLLLDEFKLISNKYKLYE